MEGTLLKKIAIAALAAGALALNAPLAQAAEPTDFGCGFESLAQETATGGQDTFTGAAYGYIVGAAGETSVTVKCEVRVNSATVASTDLGSGSVVATSQGQVTYTADDDDDVDLCTVWTTSTTGGTDCGDATTTQIPPQAVIDLLDTINQLIADGTAGLDPIICGALKTAGVPAAINSTTAVTTLSADLDDCDLYLGGELLIDFVPYGA